MLWHAAAQALVSWREISYASSSDLGLTDSTQQLKPWKSWLNCLDGKYYTHHLKLRDWLIPRSSSSLLKSWLNYHTHRLISTNSPFFFLFSFSCYARLFLACEFALHILFVLTLFCETFTRKVHIPIKRNWWCACIISGSRSVVYIGSPDLWFWYNQNRRNFPA